jgi:hypothetical protein
MMPEPRHLPAPFIKYRLLSLPVLQNSKAVGGVRPTALPCPPRAMFSDGIVGCRNGQ